MDVTTGQLGWRFWRLWTLTSVGGGAIGGLFAYLFWTLRPFSFLYQLMWPPLLGSVGFPSCFFFECMVPLALEGFAVTGAIFTLVLSTTGGVVIQRALGRPYSWRVLLALMGAAVGGALVAQTWLIIAAGFRELSGPWLSVPFLSPWLILGGGMGFGQWLILRRHGSRSLFWPLVCSLGIVVLLPIGYAFTVYGLAPAHATFGTLLWDLARLTLGSAISGLAYGAITGLALLWIFRNPRVLQTTTEDKFTHEE